MYCKRARLLSSDPRLFIHSFMNGKFMVKKQERQNIFPSAGAGALTSNFTLSPAPPSMKKLRSKGFYLVISLRHCRVTWGTHARCWSVCLQYCEWILPFFKGNLQQHHFIFIVYYRGRKVSSSFLWLTSFFPQSGRFTSNIFDEDTTLQQSMLPAPPTKARTKEWHALIVPFLPSPPFSFFPISLTLNTDQQRASASHVTPSFRTDDKIES